MVTVPVCECSIYPRLRRLTALNPTTERERETIFTCLYPYTVQTRLSRDQRPTKPVSRLGTGIQLLSQTVFYQ